MSRRKQAGRGLGSLREQVAGEKHLAGREQVAGEKHLAGAVRGDLSIWAVVNTGHACEEGL